MRVCGKDKVKRDAGKRRVDETQDHVFGKRILFAPGVVALKPMSEEAVDEFRSNRFLGEDEEVDILGGTDAAPSIDCQCTDDTVVRGRRRKGRDHRL
jgi:hypothetical protein